MKHEAEMREERSGKEDGRAVGGDAGGLTGSGGKAGGDVVRKFGAAGKQTARGSTRTEAVGGGVSSGGVSAGGVSAYPESVQRLIDELAKLPGIGRRSAERLAFHVLKTDRDEALKLARAVSDVKRTVRHCGVCFNLADGAGMKSGSGTSIAVEGSGEETGASEGAAAVPERGGSGGAMCRICASGNRDRSTVMVVEQPKDLIALEQTGMYKGVYHVLMGRISPLDGVGPGDVTIGELMGRVSDPEANAGGVAVREVVLALNPTLEADGTALYIAEQLGRTGKSVRVTRLARGVPTGTQLEFANKAVLADAIQGRQKML